MEVVSRFASICAKWSQDKDFIDNCTAAADGSCYCLLKRGNAAVDFLVKKLFEIDDQFSKALKCALDKQKTRNRRRRFVVDCLVRYTHAQAKAALGLQDSDRFSPVYLVMAGIVPETIFRVHYPWWQCTVALEDGEHPPVLFKATKHITNLDELFAPSNDSGSISDTHWQEFDQSEECTKLVKEYGDLLASPGAFERVQVTNDGPMEVGAAYCLKGGILHKPQLAPGSCQLFCVVARKDQECRVKQGCDCFNAQSLFHRTAIVADICQELLTVQNQKQLTWNQDLDKNDILALCNLLTTSIEQSHCHAPDHFFRAMEPLEPEGQELGKYCKLVGDLAQQRIKFLQSVGAATDAAQHTD
jgi:hypothetical protein